MSGVEMPKGEVAVLMPVGRDAAAVARLNRRQKLKISVIITQSRKCGYVTRVVLPLVDSMPESGKPNTVTCSAARSGSPLRTVR